MYMNDQCDNASFKTKDRFEIYVLLSSGCLLKRYEADKYGTVFFEFENVDHCKNLLAQLMSKKLKVFAHDMIGAIRDAQSVFSKHKYKS